MEEMKLEGYVVVWMVIGGLGDWLSSLVIAVEIQVSSIGWFL